MTDPVPKIKLSGRLRLGLRISPAVKVTLFQASALNKDPTIAPPATIKATSQGAPPTSSEIELKRSVEKEPAHRSAKLRLITSLFAPMLNPRIMRMIRLKVLITVKKF